MKKLNKLLTPSPLMPPTKSSRVLGDGDGASELSGSGNPLKPKGFFNWAWLNRLSDFWLGRSIKKLFVVIKLMLKSKSGGAAFTERRLICCQ